MPGRAKTPVQQAWEYANDAVGARWVLVSNMRHLRLYATGHGRANYEEFDLRRLDDPEELARLQLLLHADRLLGGATADLLARSATADRDITDALYATYRSLRDDLFQFVRDSRPAVGAENRITLVQKLLDRLIFVAFAEDTVLIPDDSIRRAVEFVNPYDPQPKWAQVRRLFEAVDTGLPTSLGIDAYNGGLFARDEALDALDLPDHLVDRFLDIAAYDFRSQVSVSILGHIFEQSISDIEALQAEARGEAPPRTTTRKRFGVVYTPEFVTRFIVDRTVGAHLAEIAAALLAEHAKGVDPDGTVRWRSKAAERDYWRAYLDRLTALRVVDPACGSGAFLIAAFDHLYAEQRRVRDRLGELSGGMFDYAATNADVEIITANLYGVDINAESVEITRLALWLKTAKKGRPLESLDANIRWGNSLIEDSDYGARAFTWADGFPAVFAEGGFDIVLGNPPYVRMELLKPIKHFLEARYAVASDRADLYAYFFELGVRILRPGGRLGYISSSTFFRTGSGAPLRSYLGEAAEVEAVVDFGDLQLFEGVTTYPAVLTLRKADGVPSDAPLRFLNLKTIPADLGLAFREDAEPMPRTRLTTGSWRFEGDRLDAIRAKMAAGRPTLAQVYGAPLRGIVTGLNEAFVLSRETRDALVARDRRSADLLKPFLVGENLKRWHVESDDLWLIYTPKNRVAIDDYPAIRDHLAPFRARLEARATKQNWWELQQPQAAYANFFDRPKTVWPHFQLRSAFSCEHAPFYLNNKCFFWPDTRPSLAIWLNSAPLTFALRNVARIKQNGYIEAEAQYVGSLPSFSTNAADTLVFIDLGEASTAGSIALHSLRQTVLHRLADIAPAIETTATFRNWPDLDFAALRALIAKRFRTDLTVAQRDEWEGWYEGKRAEAAALRASIADLEAEINARVYALFGLDRDEVAAIEKALDGQY